MPREKEEKVEGLGKDQEASILGEGNWKVFMTELYHVIRLLLEQLCQKLLPPKSADTL